MTGVQTCALPISAGTGTYSIIFGVAFVWFTTHFGGGFASGAQIYSYYVRFGIWCLLMPALAMLYNGMEFPEYIGEAKAGGAVELDCIVTNGETSEEENDNDDDLSGFEKEAEFIAERIEGLMYGNDRMDVYDNKLEEYRPLKYSDIAVVMRSMTHGAEMVEIFRQHSIPASADTSTEFLETTEVMTALNFLKLIDNPRQDIPLAAVLRSPVYGFTADELLTIKLDSGEEEYYDCVRTKI